MRPVASRRSTSSRSSSRPTRGVVSAGRSRRGRRRVGRRAPAPHLAPEREVLPLLQDRGLELAQVARRLEAEVVAQRGAEVLRHPQRLRLPARPVEGEHQLPGELLPQRVLHRHRLEPADRFLVTADAQLGVDQRLHRHQPQLVEPDRLRPLGQVLPFRYG